MLQLTRVMVFLSWRQSLLPNDSVISGMVVMRFSDMADLGRLLSSEEERRALWWGLISQFSSLILMWLGVGAIVAAWSLFNFMASNCDCRPQREGQLVLLHNVNTLCVHNESILLQRKTVVCYFPWWCKEPRTFGLTMTMPSCRLRKGLFTPNVLK